MKGRWLVVLMFVVVVGVGVLVAVGPAPTNDTTALPADQQYPPGAGPNVINFTALDAAETNLTHTPRRHWESYVLGFTETPDTPPVEGIYYINATTGEIITDRFHGATAYRNGSIYAFRQPAAALPTDRHREELAADEAYTYDNTTDTYHRYDSRYGKLAPTTIGRHTDIVEAYTWEAINTTTHYGVPVITYRLTGQRSDADRAQPAEAGTLQLGVDDGLIYAYDLTLDANNATDTYRYQVRSAPFLEHEWVRTAKRLSTTTNSS